MTTTGRAGLLLCAASIAIALSGCGSPAPPTLLRAGDDGSAVAVRVGDVLTVRLGSNLTTGHRWRLRDAGDGVLEATGWRYEPAPSPPPAPSGGEGAVHRPPGRVHQADPGVRGRRRRDGGRLVRGVGLGLRVGCGEA